MTIPDGTSDRQSRALLSMGLLQRLQCSKDMDSSGYREMHGFAVHSVQK